MSGSVPLLPTPPAPPQASGVREGETLRLWLSPETGSERSRLSSIVFCSAAKFFKGVQGNPVFTDL